MRGVWGRESLSSTRNELVYLGDMDYNNYIQEGIALLSNSKTPCILVTDILGGVDSDKWKNDNELFNVHTGMLYNCGVFERLKEGDDNNIKLSQIGWLIVTSYKCNYSSYLSSLKPIPRRVLIASTVANILLALFVLAQVYLLCIQVRNDSDIHDIKQNIEEQDSLIRLMQVEILKLSQQKPM